MALEFNNQSDTILDKAKKLNWKKIGLQHALPLVVAFSLGGIILGAGKGATGPTYATETILSDVDLPSQITKLQNSQLTVLESQLKRLGEEIDLNDGNGVYGAEDKASLVLATLNYDNNLNNFFKTLLSFEKDSNAESQYATLANFLENPLTSGTTNDPESVKEKESMVAFLNSQSWARETSSRVSLSGNVLPALLTGSTADNKMFLVTVPATNEKREFKNLSYIVSLGKTNKIRKIVYQGEIENNADLETWYKGLEAVVSDNVGEFIYLQQPSYEERKAKDDLEFLERIKTAFKLEKDGDTKKVRLDGQNVVIGKMDERTLESILKSDYQLTDDQFKGILETVSKMKAERAKAVEASASSEGQPTETAEGEQPAEQVPAETETEEGGG